jgi:predicted DNA-binding protein YlxM (UPF0122 family)
MVETVARTFEQRDTKKEKKAFPLKYLPQVFGISKQAWYQRIKRDNKTMLRNEMILAMVREMRKIHPLFLLEIFDPQNATLR